MQKTAYEMRIRDWSSDVCSSDLGPPFFVLPIRGDGQVDRPRGLRRDAGSCRPGAAFPSAGHPVLIRARAIHGALVATPGRQDTAHLDVNLVTSASTNVATTHCRRGVPIGGAESRVGRGHAPDGS